MKRCMVRLSRSNPEVSFDVNDGKTKNTVAARAWKAVSEFVGNDCDPNDTIRSKGTKKSSKKQPRQNDSTKSSRKILGVERNQPKHIQTLKQPNLQ